jgi:hypothetical protein
MEIGPPPQSFALTEPPCPTEKKTTPLNMVDAEKRTWKPPHIGKGKLEPLTRDSGGPLDQRGVIAYSISEWGKAPFRPRELVQ